MKTKYVFPPLQVERKVCARVSHPNFRSVVVVLSAFLLVVMGSLVSPQAASAGSGSIPEFSVDNNLNVHIRVSCPGSVGFTWQVAVDNWGNVFYEEGSAGKDFHMDGGRISNGHHNALARVRCNGEPTDWSGATSSTVGFDWYGGNPTPVPPPPGYEVSISLAIDHTTVPPNGQIRITAQASCSNTTVRAIRIKVNSGVFYELGSPTVTTAWSSGNPGTYVISAEAACNGDDQWKTSPGASVTVTVQQGAQPGSGGSGTGTAGNQVNPAPSNPQPQSGSGASIPQARQAGNSGGFDLITVAYAWGYGNVHNDNGRWDGWIMDGGGKPAKRLTMGDFSVICQQVYGNGFTATRVGNRAGDIKCVQGNGNNPPPEPPIQPVAPKEPVYDADGNQLRQNSDGDLVYRIAEGIGSPQGNWYIYVPTTSGSLYCRTSPEAKQDRSNVRATMRTNDYFNVIEVRGDWAKINSSLGECWVKAQYVQITDNRSQDPTQPQPGPTVTPMPAQVQSQPTAVPVNQLIEAQGLQSPPSSNLKYIQSPLDRDVLFYSNECAGELIGRLWKGDYFEILFDEVDSVSNHCYRINSHLGPGWIKGEGITVMKAQSDQSKILLNRKSWTGIEVDQDALDMSGAVTYQIQSNGNYLIRIITIDYTLTFTTPVVVCWSFPRAYIVDGNGVMLHNYTPSPSAITITFGPDPISHHEGHVDFLPYVEVSKSQKLMVGVVWICYPKGDINWDPLSDATKSTIQKQAEEAVKNSTVTDAPKPPKLFFGNLTPSE